MNRPCKHWNSNSLTTIYILNHCMKLEFWPLDVYSLHVSLSKITFIHYYIFSPTIDPLIECISEEAIMNKFPFLLILVFRTGLDC